MDDLKDIGKKSLSNIYVHVCICIYVYIYMCVFLDVDDLKDIGKSRRL